MVTENYKKYLDQAKKVHLSGHWPGGSLKDHIPAINEIIKTKEIKTALDYGCGKAKFHPTEWSSFFTKYDPGYPLYEARPTGTFDLVICTDVMEHIPEDSVEYVINDLFSYSKKYLYVNICTREAAQILPNGENAHVTVKPEKWWNSIFENISQNYPGIEFDVIFYDPKKEQFR